MSTLPLLMSLADELDSITTRTYPDDFGLGFYPHRHYHRNPSIQLSMPSDTEWLEQSRPSRQRKYFDSPPASSISTPTTVTTPGTFSCEDGEVSPDTIDTTDTNTKPLSTKLNLDQIDILDEEDYSYDGHKFKSKVKDSSHKSNKKNLDNQKSIEASTSSSSGQQKESKKLRNLKTFKDFGHKDFFRNIRRSSTNQNK